MARSRKPKVPKGLRVYVPPKTFEEALEGLSKFAAERNLSIGELDSARLHQAHDDQVADAGEDTRLERVAKEYHRAFVRRRRGRFQLLMKALGIAREHFRDDPVTLESLDKFQVVLGHRRPAKPPEGADPNATEASKPGTASPAKETSASPSDGHKPEEGRK